MMPRHIHSVLAIVVVALCVRPVGAEEAKAGFDLTLQDALTRALARHPSVARAQALGARAQAGMRQARAAWFPTLQINGGVHQYEEPMIAWPIHRFDFAAIPPFDQTLIQGSLQLDYTLLDGSRGARIRQAKQKSEAASRGTDASEQRLLASVVAGYLSVLSAEELVRAHDRRHEALTLELDRVRQLHAVGRAADVEIARAEAALAGAEADRVQVRGRLDVARRDLARMLGESPDIMMSTQLYPVSLTDDAEMNPQVSMAVALASNPEYLAQQSELRAAEAGRSAARGARWPSVSLRGQLTEYRDGNGNQTNEWNAAAMIGLPIFTGGMISGRVSEADAAYRIALEDLRLAEDRITADVDRAVAQVRESHARVESLMRAVASLEEVVRIEKLRLDTGSHTQTDYLQAEAELLAARAGLIEARHAEMLAHTTLARVTGVLSLDWIDQTLEQNR
ncbi:MAG: TolC family protein [Candidatus Zixiibacteriota bacterium]